MRTFHHYGVPSATPLEGAVTLEELKLTVTDPESHPFRIEFLQFHEGCQMPPEVQNNPHAAFMVDSIEEELQGKQVLVAPFAVTDTLKVAFFIENGAVVELMQVC